MIETEAEVRQHWARDASSECETPILMERAEFLPPYWRGDS